MLDGLRRPVHVTSNSPRDEDLGHSAAVVDLCSRTVRGPAAVALGVYLLVLAGVAFLPLPGPRRRTRAPGSLTTWCWPARTC